MEVPEWDAFISYASEERAAVAEPLFAALAELGIRVWYDRMELKVGDSLRERIDGGLATSRFGIVILSPSFFAKHYPVRELNGLAQREVDGAKVILPVWYGVSDHDVRRFSPPLADRIAARWDEGLEAVVAKLFPIVGQRVIREVEEAAKKLHDLSELTSGSQLIGELHGANAHVFAHDDFRDRDEAEIVGDFLQSVEDSIDMIDEIGAGERARIEFAFTEDLNNLRKAGWKVFGNNVMEPIGYGVKGDWPVACVAVVREERQGVVRIGSQFLMHEKRRPKSPG